MTLAGPHLTLAGPHCMIPAHPPVWCAGGADQGPSVFTFRFRNAGLAC